MYNRRSRKTNYRKPTGYRQASGAKKNKKFSLSSLQLSGDAAKDAERRNSMVIDIDTHAHAVYQSSNSHIENFALTNQAQNNNTGKAYIFEPLRFAYFEETSTTPKALWQGLRGYYQWLQVKLCISANLIAANEAHTNVIPPLVRILCMKVKGNTYNSHQHPISMHGSINNGENDKKYFVLYDAMHAVPKDGTLVIDKFIKLNNQMSRSEYALDNNVTGLSAANLAETGHTAIRGAKDSATHKDRDTERVLLWIMTDNNEPGGTGLAPETNRQVSLSIKGVVAAKGYDF